MVLFNTFCSILFLLFCLALARPHKEDINVNPKPEPKDFNGFIMTVPDCEYQLFFGNNTLTLHGDNWTNVLEETRHTFTNLMGQCKNEVNSTFYLPQVSDVLSYASSIGECPDKYVECQNRCKECQERYEECRGRNGWMITAIVFIILFLLTIGAVATFVVLCVFQIGKIRINF